MNATPQIPQAPVVRPLGGGSPPGMVRPLGGGAAVPMPGAKAPSQFQPIANAHPAVQAHPQAPESSWTDFVKDMGVGFTKGAASYPDAYVDAADLVTGDQASPLLHHLGYDPEAMQHELDSHYSPAMQYAKQQVANAHGFLPTVRAILDNPSVIPAFLAENAAPWLGGSAELKLLTKAARLAKPAAHIVHDVHDGLLTAASTAGQIQQQNQGQPLSPEQGVYALAHGAGSVLTHKLRTRLDAGPNPPVAGHAQQARGLLQGQLMDGAENAAQTAQEQMFTNLALHRPADANVGDAVASGLFPGLAAAHAMVLGDKQRPGTAMPQGFGGTGAPPHPAAQVNLSNGQTLPATDVYQHFLHLTDGHEGNAQGLLNAVLGQQPPAAGGHDALRAKVRELTDQQMPQVAYDQTPAHFRDTNRQLQSIRDYIHQNIGPDSKLYRQNGKHYLNGKVLPKNAYAYAKAYLGNLQASAAGGAVGA